ncbi:hypothetical protein GQ54DRAFT_14664, partial [Martensiomyces pterosporus]
MHARRQECACTSQCHRRASQGAAECRQRRGKALPKHSQISRKVLAPLFTKLQHQHAPVLRAPRRVCPSQGRMCLQARGECASKPAANRERLRFRKDVRHVSSSAPPCASALADCRWLPAGVQAQGGDGAPLYCVLPLCSAALRQIAFLLAPLTLRRRLVDPGLPGPHQRRTRGTKQPPQRSPRCCWSCPCLFF